MLQAEDKEALIGLEVDKISTCRDLVSNECQIAGTREVIVSASMAPILQVLVRHQSAAINQSQKQTKPVTAQQGPRKVQRMWIGCVTPICPTKTIISPTPTPTETDATLERKKGRGI